MAFTGLVRPHALVCVLAAGILAACSSDSEGPHGDGNADASATNSGNGGSSRGGTTTNGSGGRAGATGGAGGIDATGGANATGGTTGTTGGNSNVADSGMDSSSGMDASPDATDADTSVASGGTTSTGGAPATTGGVTSTGGTSASGGAAQNPTELDVTMPSVLTTELGTTNTIDVTLTGSSGFAGAVALDATVVDGSSAPLSGWTFSIDTPNPVLTQNGSTTVHLTVHIPTENKGLAATATVTATSAATSGTWSAATHITVLNQYTIDVGLAGTPSMCVYPPPGTTNITVGTKVRWLNVATSGNITIHSNGAAAGCPHQADPGMSPGNAYECTITTVTSPFTWYCHAPGPNVNTLGIAPVL